jgi:voltage-gated potassium channel
LAPVPPPDLSAFERSHLITAGVRATLTATLLLVLYFVLPVAHRPHESPVIRLAVALALFVAVLANEIRLITGHERPILRAAVAMATVLPLFLVLFAWIYLTMSQADPSAFAPATPHGLSRASALYFAITVFSTVGFGDIAPRTDVARLVVSVQMLADLAVIAVVIRLIFGAVTRGETRKQESVGDAGPAQPAEE